MAVSPIDESRGYFPFLAMTVRQVSQERQPWRAPAHAQQDVRTNARSSLLSPKHRNEPQTQCPSDSTRLTRVINPRDAALELHPGLELAECKSVPPRKPKRHPSRTQVAPAAALAMERLPHCVDSCTTAMGHQARGSGATASILPKISPAPPICATTHPTAEHPLDKETPARGRGSKLHCIATTSQGETVPLRLIPENDR